MVNLTQEQLRKIQGQVSDGAELREILQNQFPDAVIYIIRGHDSFNYESYVKGAFFNEGQASQLMGKLSSNITLQNTYHVVTGTIGDLTNDRISDQKTGHALSNIDKHMIYSSLEGKLDK